MNSFKTLLLVGAIAVATLVAPTVVHAQADTKGPNIFQGITGLPNNVTTAAKSNLTASAIANNRLAIRPGYGLSFTALFAPGSSSVSNVTFEVSLSYDGTNYCTDNPLNAVFNCKGTAGVRMGTNFPASALEGARFASLTAVTNAALSTVVVTNAGLSVVK